MDKMRRSILLLVLFNLAFLSSQASSTTTSNAATAATSTTILTVDMTTSTAISTSSSSGTTDGIYTSTTNSPGTTTITTDGNYTSTTSSPVVTVDMTTSTAISTSSSSVVTVDMTTSTAISTSSSSGTTTSTTDVNYSSTTSSPGTTTNTTDGNYTPTTSSPVVSVDMTTSTAISTSSSSGTTDGIYTSTTNSPGTTTNTTDGNYTSTTSSPVVTVDMTTSTAISTSSSSGTTTSTTDSNFTSTTSSPGTTTITTDSNYTSTTSSPDTTTNTTFGNDTSTTSSPGWSDITSSTATTTPDRPVSTKPCDKNPCGNATCINSYNISICKCPFAFFYNANESSCILGKSFYGILTLKEAYSASLENKESPEFQAVYENVTNFFKECFTDMDFGQTVISEISPEAPSSRTWRAATGTGVKVINIFMQNSLLTEENVTDAINKYVSNSSSNYIYTRKDVCHDGFYCDSATTDCTVIASYPTCTCKNGYFANSAVTTTCRACEPGCGAAGSMTYCHFLDKPVCKCQPNYVNTSGKCEPCSVGYSGEDCDNNTLLILIIVAAVGGAVLLALIGAVIGISVKSKKSGRSYEKRQLIDNEEPMDLANYPGKFLFPKIQVKNGLSENQSSSNPYEREEQYARPVPTRDYDDEGSRYDMTRSKPSQQSRF